MAFLPDSEAAAGAQAAEEGESLSSTATADPTAAQTATVPSMIVPPTPAWVALHAGDAAAAAAAAVGAAAGAVDDSGALQQQEEQQQRRFEYSRMGEQHRQQRKESEDEGAVAGAPPLWTTAASSSTGVTVAACGLSQWALDFRGNCIRVEESMRRAKAAGAAIRVGPELELSGYSCEDHFLEEDTTVHSWESLAALLSTNATDDLLCDVGIAVSYKSARYNCRAWLLNRRILLLRPATVLRDYGNYHESRYFSTWHAVPTAAGAPVASVMEEFPLPFCVTRVNGQTHTPFGVALLQCRDGVVGSIFLEELLAASSGKDTVVSLVCADADILCCCAAAHFQVGQYEQRLRAVQQASQYCVAVYSNQQGCDGGRLFFDGTAAVCAAGEILGLVRRFSFEEIQVVAAAVDLSDLRALRAAAPAAWKKSEPQQLRLPTVQANFSLCASRTSQAPAGLAVSGCALASRPPAIATVPLPVPPLLEPAGGSGATQPPAKAVRPVFLSAAGQQEHRGQQPQQQQCWESTASPWVTAEEETARTAACWLWDCLRRSGARGFFLALSGGADSAAVAALVALMCKGVMNEVRAGHVEVLAALERVLACRCIRRGGSSSGSRMEGTEDSSGGDADGRGGEEEVRLPVDAKEVCHALLYTCYMSTHHSSTRTRGYAASLAEQIGSFHLAVEIDAIVAAFADVAASVSGNSPRFVAQGGTTAEDVALQNIQARIRMALAYFMAQLLPLSALGSNSRSPLEQQLQSAHRGEARRQSAGSNSSAVGKGVRITQLSAGAAAAPSASSADASVLEGRQGTFLLVLGTANADEGLRGYFTKYDASSADINPIGSMGKLALRRGVRVGGFLASWCVQEIAVQVPTAELRPETASGSGSDATLSPQTDEEDMGMTYRELADYGRLRKTLNCGPVSMFKRLLRERGGSAEAQRPSTIAQKVVHFFRQYGRHRHKTCTLTPALHVDPSNAEDSRFDPRPFLYPPWDVQFEQIGKIALQRESAAPIYGESYEHFRN